jgi:hypothetical protein
MKRFDQGKWMDRKEVTVWILNAQHPEDCAHEAKDCAQWVRITPPTEKLLTKEMGYHPRRTKFFLRRERRTMWREWGYE